MRLPRQDRPLQSPSAPRRQRRRLQLLEALGNLDERRSQPLGWDVLLAQNVEGSADLTLVEIEFRLQLCNQLPLCLGVVRVLPDKQFKLRGRNANSDGRVSHAAADRDGTALGPHRGLLRLRAWRQRQDGDAQHDHKRRTRGHAMSHFDAGAATLAGAFVVILLSMTPPPIAIPLGPAWTFGGGEAVFGGGAK
jgi:hypothetical protein